MNEGEITIMNKIYGLQNDKENISLIIGDDKPLLIIQTAESFKVRELNLQYDNEDLEEISAIKFKPINISANEITGGNISQFVRDNGKDVFTAKAGDNVVEISKDGIKTTAKNITLNND